MDSISSHERIPAAYADDKPFRMSELPNEDIADLQAVTDSLHAFSNVAAPVAVHGQRFIRGFCFALPLAALLWILLYYAIQKWSFLS